MFGFLYKLFGRITKEKAKHYLKTRLIYYVIALLIFFIGGAKGLVMTTLLILSFFLGWVTNKLINAFKDWRLTQRLNRIHFTAVEYDQMQRERDMAIEAWKTVTREAAASERRNGSDQARGRQPRQVRFTESDISEYMAQHGMEVKE